jgi:flap endonuclease-1
MGIKDLIPLLKETCPDHILETVPLSQFAGLRVAIDISIYLYKFIRSAGEDLWPSMFMRLLILLKETHISPVCIFDGANCPIEKKKEQAARRASTNRMVEKLDKARDFFRDLDEEKEIDMEQLKKILTVRNKPDNTDYDNPASIRESLSKLIIKLEKQTKKITSDHADLAIEMIDLMGIAWMKSDGEAEMLCARLAVAKKVDAVLTEDTDVLAYGTPILICKLDTTRSHCMVIHLPSVLEELDWKLPQFRDMCIMLKCDYNQRAKMKKGKGKGGVGKKKVLAFIQEHKSIEAIELNEPVDTDPLNYVRCRQIFTIPSTIGAKEFRLPYSRTPDYDRLEEFISKYQIRADIDQIKELWKPPVIIIEKSK